MNNSEVEDLLERYPLNCLDAGLLDGIRGLLGNNRQDETFTNAYGRLQAIIANIITNYPTGAIPTAVVEAEVPAYKSD